MAVPGQKDFTTTSCLLVGCETFPTTNQDKIRCDLVYCSIIKCKFCSGLLGCTASGHHQSCAGGKPSHEFMEPAETSFNQAAWWRRCGSAPQSRNG